MLSSNRSVGTGKLYVVGIGPGCSSMRTFAAHNAIMNADVVVGYKTYINLVKDLTENKNVDSSGMHDEVERVTRAIDYALEGQTVALISSGDPGVYGMAGLALEICKNNNIEIDIEIIAGVTAANSAAALLGAPLSCDYCVVSLSDLLVNREQILRRVECAAMGDFVTVIYNPVSRKRIDLIYDVQRIFFNYLPPDTPVGIVEDIGRTEEKVIVSTLELFVKEVKGMTTTVIIGNLQTILWKNRMVNPRGYYK